MTRVEQTNVWLLRPMPHGTNQMQYFLERNRIAIGYPVGESLAGLSNEEIRNNLRAVHRDWESGIGNVDRLVRFMKVGDIVVVPDENSRDVYLAKISSDYIYESSLDINQSGSGFPHQREVSWFFDKKPLSRGDLPEALLKSLRFPGATADLSKHLLLVAEIINDPSLVEQNQNSDPSYDRLYERALEVLEEALNSSDIVTSLKAAEIILRYNRT
jgi:restriction system protein